MSEYQHKINGKCMFALYLIPIVVFVLWLIFFFMNDIGENLRFNLTFWLCIAFQLVFIPSFHYLEWEDEEGKRMTIRYGPLPFYTWCGSCCCSPDFSYDEIASVELGQGECIDGCGMRFTKRCYWFYSVNCCPEVLVITNKEGTLWKIETDDGERLKKFIDSKLETPLAV